MNQFKKFFAFCLAGAMTLCLVACGGSDEKNNVSGMAGENPSGEETSVYRQIYSTEVTTLNYLTTCSTIDYVIGANVVDCLVEYDQYGNILPALAESWEHNDDMTQWTFHIRKGVKWVDKNGNEVAEVTAADWVSTARYVNDAHNASAAQYMYNTGSIVHNAQNYYDYTAYLLALETLGLTEGEEAVDEDGNRIEPVDPVSPDDIGVSAKDDYTLVYTLDQPCPFFLSILSYTSYMPVYGPFLEEQGSRFGLDNDSLLYNGAYILSVFEPQYQQIFTRNLSYWDKDNVFIDEIHRTYNAEENSVAVSMYQNGEVDYAAIPSDLLDSMMKDKTLKDMIHCSRADNSFSFFFCFNFDPQFDEEYEPDNWRLAVNNENFRKSLMTGLDRMKALTVSDPYHPEMLLNNTITPSDFAVGGGKDYTLYDSLVSYTEGDSFDADRALEYRDAARDELSAKGVTFPVKILMPYNPSYVNWGRECQVIEQQLEGLLGNDYIDIIIEAGPETGFLSSVRYSGKYAMLKCNWGADYADPQTWTEPFSEENSYCYWETSEDETTGALYQTYASQVDLAASIYQDDEERYSAFAEAEAMLLEHAIVIPYSIRQNGGYMISKLNPLEGEYAPYGVVLERFKYKKLYDTSMSMEEFETAYEKWKEDKE